ncbi:hypothetical protein D3C87_1738020 [compost metagenome]
MFSCTSLKVNNSKIEGIEDFEINLNKVTSTAGQSGWGVNMSPIKGNTFLRLDVNIKNISMDTREINFNDLFLVHFETKTKYPLIGAYMPTLVTLGAKSKRKVIGNETIHRILLYSFPKKKAPDFLMYKEKLIPIDISY